MPKAGKRKKKKGGKVQRRTTASARVRKPAAAESDANGGARLIFPPNFQGAGFTSAGISQFNDRDIPSAIRELIQNSLDAATGIGRRPAIVRFSVETHPLARVPSLRQYRSAFERAKAKYAKDKGERSGLGTDIIENIDQGLQTATSPFLFVEDNGVGLDPRRMDALLGDGENIKDSEDAIGAYGNGHWTVFELSRLRYILYGGVTKEGVMTASGHAILASHRGDDGKRCGKDGFYVVRLSDRDGEPHTYPQGAEIPDMLEERLKSIQREFKSDSGTVIAVPGFDHFGEDNSMSITEEIKKVAALNFFPAIHEGNLEVRVRDDGAEDVLTQSNLPHYMTLQEEDKARKKAGFPTGAKAAASYRTLTEGAEHFVPIDGENLRMFLRQGAEQKIGATRVVFCRDGMWVADQVEMLTNSHFTGKVPFDALLLADVKGCKKFHYLMSKAEGQLHIGLIPKRLKRLKGGDRRRAFENARAIVREYLRKEVKDSEREEFEPSNFYQIETGQSVGGGKMPSVIRGEAKPVPGTAAHIAAVKKKKAAGKKSAAQKRRTGTTMTVKTMSKPIGANRVQIGVSFQEDCDNCELQMALDPGTDPTCVGALDGGRLYVRNAKILNGGDLRLVGEEGKRVGVFLGGARAGERRVVEVEFEGGQLRESVLQTVFCEFYRRAAKSRASEEEAA